MANFLFTIHIHVFRCSKQGCQNVVHYCHWSVACEREQREIVQFTNPELKSLILDVVAFIDDVNAEGKHLKRSHYNKQHYRAAQSVLEKLLAQMNLFLSDGSTVKLNEYKPSEGIFVVAERHSVDHAIELSDKEIQMIKYYYDERDELIAVSSSALDEFEKLIGK